MHNGTFREYGFPPVPKGPVPAGAAAGTPDARLARTYYRGNDERGPALFNGGRYLAYTFRISLETDGGGAEGAAEAGGRTLFLRLDVARAPNTDPELFTEERFARAFLTASFGEFLGETEPVPDRTPFRAVEPGRRWEARYPLGRIAGDGEEDLRGIVYLCEEHRVPPLRYWLGIHRSRGTDLPFHDQRLVGMRYRQGIRYDLSFLDGVLLEGSSLRMGSLYRPGRGPDRLPYEEWISETPYPLKTDPEIR